MRDFKEVNHKGKDRQPWLSEGRNRHTLMERVWDLVWVVAFLEVITALVLRESQQSWNHITSPDLAVAK
jgi:hypothetical protein